MGRSYRVPWSITKSSGIPQREVQQVAELNPDPGMVRRPADDAVVLVGFSLGPLRPEAGLRDFPAKASQSSNTVTSRSVPVEGLLQQVYRESRFIPPSSFPNFAWSSRSLILKQ